ncbi:MAG: Glu/Leu/Phe/Val dehydrogenase [Desulfurococcaceae archaeon]
MVMYLSIHEFNAPYEQDPTYQMAVKQLKGVAELIGLHDEVVEVLRHPEKLIQVRVVIKLDNGKLATFIGWRSQHNSALGPYKGGIRYHPSSTAGETVALSMWMTWKNSLAGLPYGGGKGAVRVDPKKLSIRELEELSRKYFASIAKEVGPDLDIPAPDVYTNPQVMAWFLDEYSKISGYNAWGVVTAKPPILGGLKAREISTGYGVALIAREASKRALGGFEGRTVAVQGFGNVGSYAALYSAQWGARVVAISDSQGGVYDPRGLDIAKAIEVKSKTGSVVNYEGVKRISNEDLLELDVDILIPAAVENVIREDNAPRVKAKIVSEGANGPTTPEADKILYDKGVIIIPDVLANAGGVAMSWIEWSHNRMGCILTDEEALSRLDKLMTQNFHRVYDEWQRKYSDKPMRTAAYAIAIDRVVQAMKLRGWV